MHCSNLFILLITIAALHRFVLEETSTEDALYQSYSMVRSDSKEGVVHCPKNKLIIRIKAEPVTVGADSTVCVWFFWARYVYENSSRTYICHFLLRFRLFFGTVYTRYRCPQESHKRTKKIKLILYLVHPEYSMQIFEYVETVQAPISIFYSPWFCWPP